MTVNIYIHTTANAPKKKITAFGFVLECETSKGPATLTHFGIHENVNKNQAELLALEEAIKKLNKPCDLVIYTTPYIWAAFSMWLPTWKANGWKNKKGKDVDEVYKRLETLLKPHNYSFRTEEHSYSEWLSRETKKEEEKCLINMAKSARQQSLPK